MQMNDRTSRFKKTRCEWPTSDPLLIRYHDKEWGVPIENDKKIFEFLVLESAQAGLSWITILRKREGYRKAFAGFDPKKVSQFKERDVDRLLKNPEIIRNRLKIEATIYPCIIKASLRGAERRSNPLILLEIASLRSQ